MTAVDTSPGRRVVLARVASGRSFAFPAALWSIALRAHLAAVRWHPGGPPDGLTRRARTLKPCGRRPAAALPAAMLRCAAGEAASLRAAATEAIRSLNARRWDPGLPRMSKEDYAAALDEANALLVGAHRLARRTTATLEALLTDRRRRRVCGICCAPLTARQKVACGPLHAARLRSAPAIVIADVEGPLW